MSGTVNSELISLRLAAREIFQEALRAVDAGDAIRRAVRLEESRLTICDTAIDLGTGGQKIYSVAIGKAALPMAAALEEILADTLAAGIIAGPIAGQPLAGAIAALPRKIRTRWRWCEGGHPLPNRASLLAARKSFDLLELANQQRALVIFLVSGGGSAILEWPIDDQITLADLRAANRALVACGATIAEVNTVRRAFSAVKGGRLAARAPNSNQITLIVSDVPAGDEANVASGPTLIPPSDAPLAVEVISKYHLDESLPASILRAVAQRPLAKKTSGSVWQEPRLGTHAFGVLPPHQPGSPLRRYFVLLDNRSVLEAAATAGQTLGFRTETAFDISDQPIDEGCALLLSRAFEFHRRRGLTHAEAGSSEAGEGACLISGGEFRCPVRGNGAGGRNAETVLRLAIAMDRLREQKSRPRLLALCAGTDGIDGNSPAAGAIADETTIARARARGLDEQKHLAGSDAFTFFNTLGEAIFTGPTGTNVRDLRLLLIK